jgi:hypothetical protein
MRDKALKILQDETGSFEETSRLREDILDAMIAFKKGNIPSEEEINNAAVIDYQQQKKYDNAYDRQKGFQSGVKWLLSVLK